jgi:DNA-binding transcriptional MerR regulator
VDDLLPIGRFAKATRLSVKALRHYDELGLLRPAFVDPSSGYRYYRPAQANQAEAIRILRSVEMPLGTGQVYGTELAGGPREVYLNDPGQTDEADLLTEVQWPIR